MERVTFQNKGNAVVGDLFKPDGAEQGTQYPAIVVTHPFGAVKEQVPRSWASARTRYLQRCLRCSRCNRPRSFLVRFSSLDEFGGRASQAR